MISYVEIALNPTFKILLVLLCLFFLGGGSILLSFFFSSSEMLFTEREKTFSVFGYSACICARICKKCTNCNADLDMAHKFPNRKAVFAEQKDLNNHQDRKRYQNLAKSFMKSPYL